MSVLSDQALILHPRVDELPLISTFAVQQADIRVSESTMTVFLNIFGREATFLIDTGSSLNIVHLDFLREHRGWQLPRKLSFCLVTFRCKKETWRMKAGRPAGFRTQRPGLGSEF